VQVHNRPSTASEEIIVNSVTCRSRRTPALSPSLSFCIYIYIYTYIYLGLFSPRQLRYRVLGFTRAARDPGISRDVKTLPRANSTALSLATFPATFLPRLAIRVGGSKCTRALVEEKEKRDFRGARSALRPGGDHPRARMIPLTRFPTPSPSPLPLGKILAAIWIRAREGARDEPGHAAGITLIPTGGRRARRRG